MVAKRITQAAKATAYTLRHFLGYEAGVRVSAAQAVLGLPRLQQRTARSPELLRAKLDPLVAAGLAVLAPGPRGGCGWALTEAGASLIRDALYEGRPPPPLPPRPDPVPGKWTVVVVGERRRVFDSRVAAEAAAEAAARAYPCGPAVRVRRATTADL